MMLSTNTHPPKLTLILEQWVAALDRASVLPQDLQGSVLAAVRSSDGLSTGAICTLVGRTKTSTVRSLVSLMSSFPPKVKKVGPNKSAIWYALTDEEAAQAATIVKPPILKPRHIKAGEAYVGKYTGSRTRHVLSVEYTRIGGAVHKDGGKLVTFSQNGKIRSSHLTSFIRWAGAKVTA